MLKPFPDFLMGPQTEAQINTSLHNAYPGPIRAGLTKTAGLPLPEAPRNPR